MDASSLRDALAAADDLAGRRIADRERVVAVADLAGATCLDHDPLDLAGRRVLLATSGQLLAGLALVELDGLAEAVVLCPPDLAAAHLPEIVARSGVDVVVSDRPSAELPGSETLQRVEAVWPPRAAAMADPHGGCGPHGGCRPRGGCETAWLLLTSGTTGAPKLVRHSLAGLTGAIRSAARAPAAFAARGDSPRRPVWATFYDIRRYGGLQIFLRGLLGSGSLVLSCPDEEVGATLRRFGREGVTHLSGTPSHWRRALMSPWLAELQPDYVRLSGEIADQAVLDGLRHAFPRAAIGHAYASTEAGVGFDVNDGLEGFPASLLDRRGTGVEMKVAEGSLRIRSDRTAAGYVGAPDLALRDHDGFVDTGDMVEERSGRFHFVGRRGGIINVGGLKVHPEEVEAVLNRHPVVRMSRVTGRRNPITGAVVVAEIVWREPPAAGEEALKREVLDACRRTLPPHKVPATIRAVPALAVTEAGKLVRVHG